MKISTLLVCAVFFAVMTVVHAQTPIQLRRSFGPPVTEVYRTEPGISIIANYDSQGRVCDLQLEGNYFMARKIADRLVPLKPWGRLIHPPVSLIGAMDCCESWAYEYEKLIMTTSWGTTAQPAIRYVFKGRECVVKQPPMRTDRLTPAMITQTPAANRGKPNAGNANRLYGKYETTQPAVITDLPVPELTPEAIAHPDLGEMILQAVLRPSGEVGDIVLRGHLRNGMTDKALAAARKIKFKPALPEDKPVSQRILIKYSVQKCDGNRICAGAVEILDFP